MTQADVWWCYQHHRNPLIFSGFFVFDTVCDGSDTIRGCTQIAFLRPYDGICRVTSLQALPSIAFECFSGSAKGVTARQVAGGTILSVKSWPTGQTTNAQVARRTSISKILKSWKLLSNDQMREWDRLAEHTSGQSAFGQKAEISGMNLYIRLNVNRAMAGETLLSSAPAGTVAVPNVEYSQIAVTPELVAITDIKHQASPYKLVVKMSAGQSAGISNGWSKTVIITPGIEDDWGEADVTTLYLKTIGVEPVPGQKVFVESDRLAPAQSCTPLFLYKCEGQWSVGRP